MLIIEKNDDGFVIKVFKEYEGNFDIYNKDSIHDFFHDIFVKLKKQYDLKGLVDVDVYVNSEYGIIIEIHPVCDFFDEVDMKIKIHLGSVFLVPIDINNILDYEDVYYYKGKFYGTYLGLCDNEVLYKDVDQIIEYGIKVC